MIKPEDLRIGDLVRVNRDCAFPKGTMCAVTDIRPEKVFKDKVGVVSLSAINDDDDGPWGAWCCYIEGIPLTPELLEKNRFKEEQHQKEGTSEWYGFYHYDLALISCMRSKEISLLPTSTAKSYEKLNTFTNSNISFGRWG